MSLYYIRSLDGIRALAVFLVILFHWKLPLLHLEFGWSGVSIFFVLSGYLITRILINSKQTTLGHYLKVFYVKRTLRIFPLYYGYLIAFGLFLVLVKVFSLPGFTRDILSIKSEFLLLLTYTYNFSQLLHLLGEHVQRGSMFIGHLWSLSVEEQFYLIFPFVVYFCSTKSLRYILLAIVVLCPILRLGAGEYLHDKGTTDLVGQIIYRGTMFQADALA